jgi:hypothetical protein
MIYPTAKAENFPRRGWTTGQIRLKRIRRSRFRRREWLRLNKILRDVLRYNFDVATGLGHAEDGCDLTASKRGHEALPAPCYARLATHSHRLVRSGDDRKASAQCLKKPNHSEQRPGHPRRQTRYARLELGPFPRRSRYEALLQHTDCRKPRKHGSGSLPRGPSIEKNLLNPPLLFLGRRPKQILGLLVEVRILKLKTDCVGGRERFVKTSAHDCPKISFGNVTNRLALQIGSDATGIANFAQDRFSVDAVVDEWHRPIERQVVADKRIGIPRASRVSVYSQYSSNCSVGTAPTVSPRLPVDNPIANQFFGYRPILRREVVAAHNFVVVT